MKRLLNFLRQHSYMLSIIAIIISGLSAIFTFQQYQLNKSLAHLHMEPVIKTSFDFPEAKNPIVLISNVGDIPAVSLSVTHNLYAFDKLKKKITITAKQGYFLSDKIIYRNELSPNNYEKSELARVEPSDNTIIVYIFNLRYYRKNDMREYRKQEIFFVEGGKAYNHMEFSKNINYPPIMAEIEKQSFPEITYDPGKMREILDVLEKKSTSTR